MHSIRRWLLVLLGLAVSVTAGCGRKEVTSLQRKQGASLVSEAEFAVTMRDYPRAEGLLAQAVAVCPDTPDYWISLGSTRRWQGNRDGAKAAYGEALKADRDNYRRGPKNAGLRLQEVYVLALLGRMDEARAVLEQTRKDHPDDRNVRMFVENRELEQLPDNPHFKENAL
jgi:tetratricopeptide (TPR) repeat protein